jgi:predicted DNA-binding transcriptional regulator AlpA
MAPPDQIAFAWREPEAAAVAPRRRATTHRPKDTPAPAQVPSVMAKGPEPGPVEAPPGETVLPPETELWRIQHAARFLKMSPSWIYKRVERGELPCVRVNGWALRFVPAQLREWAESQGKRRTRSAKTTER